jgi:hypothetical protein
METREILGMIAVGLYFAWKIGGIENRAKAWEQRVESYILMIGKLQTEVAELKKRAGE